MLSQSAKKARLTFKLELDELWINTGNAGGKINLTKCLFFFLAETTKKIPMAHIRNIVDEPIEGHDGYSIVGFQTGTT